MTSHSIPLARPDISSPLTTHRKSLNALTGIRFFAAMQVVLFHFGGTYAQRHGAPRVITNFLANGWIAVTLFFILSGFILSYNYVGQVEKPGGKRRFWEARFARIYPVYLLSLLLSLPFVNSLSAGLGIAVLTMVQAWNPEHPEYAFAWNTTAWTLSIEAFFYLVFPFLLPHIQKLSSRMMQALLGITIAVMVLGHTMTHTVEQLSVRTFIPVPVFRFPEFFAGMLMGLLFLRADPVRRGSLRVYASLIAAVAILCTVQGPWLSLIAIPYTILIYEMAVGSSFVARMLGHKSLVLLGGASYAIYLLQIPIRSWVHFAITGTRDLKVDHAGIDALLSPIILIGVSIAAFLFWEEPARIWLRKMFKRYNERIVPAA